MFLKFLKLSVVPLKPEVFFWLSSLVLKQNPSGIIGAAELRLHSGLLLVSLLLDSLALGVFVAGTFVAACRRPVIYFKLELIVFELLLRPTSLLLFCVP